MDVDRHQRLVAALENTVPRGGGLPVWRLPETVPEIVQIQQEAKARGVQISPFRRPWLRLTA
jgi:hypothetical protein